MNNISTGSDAGSPRRHRTIFHQVWNDLMIACDHPGKRQPRTRLLRERRAGVAFVVAYMLPVLVAFGVLGVETGQVHLQKTLLKQTVTAAALAGANLIATYYTSSPNSTTTIVSAAQAIATANMSVAKYGTVVPAVNVVLGTWNAAASPPSFTNGGTSPNAVQVTGLQTAANHNAVTLFFSRIIGYGSYDLTATAVASYGTGQTFNTIIINDLTQSFSSDISAQQAADTAILQCIIAAAGTSSKFGITAFNGHSFLYEPLTQAGTNSTAIQAKITGLTGCSVTPNCSTGSNVASGIYSAIQQFGGTGYANTKNSVIIITDGVPSVLNNATKTSYATADGIGPTATPSTLQVCGNTVNTTCTSANLLAMATNQAAAARKANISISTIYYSGNTAANLQASYTASLAALSGGTGISLVAPTSASISTTFAAFCATMASSLKAVSH
jgi:hypothetical protein